MAKLILNQALLHTFLDPFPIAITCPQFPVNLCQWHLAPLSVSQPFLGIAPDLFYHTLNPLLIVCLGLSLLIIDSRCIFLC